MTSPTAEHDAAAPPMVRVRNLGKMFKIYQRPGDRLWDWLGLTRVAGVKPPTDFWAVRDLSFDLHRGQCLGILGANGSGKSTLLKMITGALHPTTGAYDIRGRVLSLIELGTGLNPLLTGRQNIVHAAALLGFPADYARTKMAEIEAFAELGDFFDRQVNVYSSGMRVRLAFSMFACFRPELFIVDEALSVGDVFFQQKCVARLRELLAGGMTMIFVSHDQSAVLNLCHKAIVMSRGEAIFQGPPEEAVSRYLASLRGGSRYARATSDASIGGAARQQASRDALALAEATIEHDIIGDRAKSRHGTGALIVRAARVLDANGLDTTIACVGDTLTFRLLLHARDAIAAPRCGLRLYDRLSNLVFAAGTYNLGLSLPAMNPGDQLVVDLAVTMDVEPGQYTFGLGAGEPDPSDEHSGAGLAHDRIELLGPLAIPLRQEERRKFYGIARLPMKGSVAASVPGAPVEAEAVR